MSVNSKTGNATVDAIGQLEHKLIGVLAPYPWFANILDARGRPYFLAILILAEIVGWYRPGRNLSKEDNSTVFYKRFKRDQLQLSRSYLASHFNTDKDTITTALNHLVKLGAIVKQSRDITQNGHIFRNSLFIWPVPEVIAKLCETDGPGDESEPTESAEVTPITGATWPPSSGVRGLHDGGDVVACNGLRIPIDPGDVSPVMGVDTVTTQKSNRNSTATTNRNSLGAGAAAVVVGLKNAGASPPAPPLSSANAPTAQAGKLASKLSADSSQQSGAKRQPAGKPLGDAPDGFAAASGPEAPAANLESADLVPSTSESDSQAKKFLRVFVEFYVQYFDRDYQVKPQDMQTATQYFEKHPDRSALEVANYLLRAWELSDQKDGEYSYGCCKQAKTVAGFFKFLERDDEKRGIADDVESRFNSYWNCDKEWLLKSLGKSCGNQPLISEIFSQEADQIRKRKTADRQAKSRHRALTDQEPLQADQQREAARQAQIANPTEQDLKSARETVYQAYQVALGLSKRHPVPQTHVDFNCRILGLDLPAIREWYSECHGRPTSGDTEPDIPSKLRERLACELKTLTSPDLDLPPIGGEKTTNKQQQ